MLIKPSLSSIWLAEDIIDEDNGRTTLRGVFNQIALTSENGEYESLPGDYVWELYLDDESLGSTRMTAVRAY